MKPATRSFYAHVIQRTIEHIVPHLDDALDLQTLARDACLSPFHFHRVFRGMVGETPVELIRRIRMERAAWHLSHDTGAITGIAFDAGYETHEAFTRAFRACYNMSPSEFRLQHRARTELAAACGIHFSPDGVVQPFTARDSGEHMDVTISDMPEMRVGTVHHTGPYNQIGQAFGRLGAIAGPAGLMGRPGAAMIAIYHDDPEAVPADQLRSDAGVVVGGDAVMPPGLDEQRVPAGRYARTVHVGPYEQLGDVWARFLGEWLPASGHRIGTTASYEIYRNDPTTTPREQLRTEIYIPLTS